MHSNVVVRIEAHGPLLLLDERRVGALPGGVLARLLLKLEDGSLFPRVVLSRELHAKVEVVARLEEARLKVEQINLPEEGGSVSTKPFDTR